MSFPLDLVLQGAAIRCDSTISMMNHSCWPRMTSGGGLTRIGDSLCKVQEGEVEHTGLGVYLGGEVSTRVNLLNHKEGTGVLVVEFPRRADCMLVPSVEEDHVTWLEVRGWKSVCVGIVHRFSLCIGHLGLRKLWILKYFRNALCLGYFRVIDTDTQLVI